MDNTFEELVVELRANTQKFATDLQSINGIVDSTLIDGFSRAGNSLERSLVSALRKGTLGFDDLKRIALRSLDEIAAHALSSSLETIFDGGAGGLGGLLGNSLGALLGLPGRATGGPVSPGRGYVVGETGPELFVPTSSGRVENADSLARPGREVRVAINLNTTGAVSAPVAMRRSSRQLASAVRAALQNS